MVKQFIASILTFAICVAACAMEPHVKTIKTKVEKYGEKLVKSETHMYFPNGTIWYMTHNKPGNNQIIKKKWGDYFFGLEFGRPKGTNGGWSLWNFFDCYAKFNGQTANIPQRFLPESIYMTRIKNVTMGEILFSLSEDAKGGKMSMRLMQFPSHKNWLFIKIEFIKTQITPWRLTFSAYPGNSNAPKERERWIATKESRYCVSKKSVSFPPLSNALVMYSKYLNDNAGNLIVFESSKMKKIHIPKAGAGVQADFHLKKDVKELKFAIGYFIDKSTSDVLPRFLGESQDNIAKFMSEINWSPQLNTSEFETIQKRANETLGSLKDSALNRDVFETKLAKIADDFKTARANSDSSTASNCLARLKQLKHEMAKTWLSQLK